MLAVAFFNNTIDFITTAHLTLYPISTSNTAGVTNPRPTRLCYSARGRTCTLYTLQNYIIMLALRYTAYCNFYTYGTRTTSLQTLWPFAPPPKIKIGHPLVLTNEAVLAGDSGVVDEHVHTSQAGFYPTEHLQNIILVTQVTKFWIQMPAALAFRCPILHRLTCAAVTWHKVRIDLQLLEFLGHRSDAVQISVVLGCGASSVGDSFSMFLNSISRALIVCFLGLSITPTSYTTYVLSRQLVSAPELSHHQASNKNYKMEALMMAQSPLPR